MSKERRLGRGLEALLGRNFETPSIGAPASLEPLPASSPASSEVAAHAAGPATGHADVTHSPDGQQWLPLSSISANPYQPRTTFDESEIADLCDSIRTHGFLQPILVRRSAGGYQIIAGERRLRAAQMAGWERVPVQIRDVADRQMAELAIVENVQRKDLNAIEKAASFKRYMDEYGCTQEEVASRVSIDRSTVANLVRLLDLPDEVKQMIARGEISAGHARALLPLGDEHEQIEFAKRIHKDSLSVRATEQAVSEHIRNADGGVLSIVDEEGNSRPSPMQPGQHLRHMESQLALALGAQVQIRQSAKGRGRITIHFGSHEEFDRLRGLLSQSPAPQSGAM
ncbi:MAG: chromosome partitioning protein ParB [Planctomycetota bacterium]|nr:MAG: chromosome partitioning protein ParB [Planctomycetota bacterium]